MLIKQYVRVKLKDLTPHKRIDWSEEQLGMKGEIINNYNPRIGSILISTDNKVCNGNHRYSILLEHYGGEHTIIVKRGRFSKRTYNIVISIFVLIVAIIISPYYLITSLFRLVGFKKNLKVNK